MFKEIHVYNYRSIYESKMEGLESVNVLFGENNAGKTTFLQAIYSGLKTQVGESIFHHFEGAKKHRLHPGVSTIIRFVDVEGEEIVTNASENNVDAMGFASGAAPESYFIQSDRGLFGLRTSIIGGNPPRNVGVRGEDVYTTLAYLKLNREKLFNEIRETFNSLGFEINTIDIKMDSPGYIYMTFIDEQLDEEVPMRLGGWGQNQVASMIIQSIISPPGSILLFEEPEISLHPGAQRTLLTKFIDIAIAGGKQFFLTTHSSYYIDTFERWAKMESADSKYLENLSIYNVERKDGNSIASRIDPKDLRRDIGYYSRT